MQPTYTNSKGQQVVIADMELAHLLNSLSANARCIGIGDIDAITIDQKVNEVKHMHADILRRFEDARTGGNGKKND